KPVLPIEERPVPQSTIPGEVTSPTQPIPVTLPVLARQSLQPSQAWGLTEADRKACRADLQSMTGLSLFSPPSLNGSLAIPSNYGGLNWSGYAWDARNQHLIVAVSNIPVKVQLIPADQFAKGNRGSFR